MKNTSKIIVVLFLLTSTFFYSCSMMDNHSTNPSAEKFLTLIPANNSNDVEFDEAIVMQFASPVDSKIIEDNFVLLSKNSFSDINCPEGNDMEHVILNTQMSHLKNQHHIKGNFKWNSDMTLCEFTPDISLEANTEYIMYMDNIMVEHMKGIMKNNGMMSNGMRIMNCDCMNYDLDNSNIITYFRTKAN